MQLIQVNIANPRRLLVSSLPYYGDMSLGDSASTNTTLYKHELPATSNIGIALKGFPPFVSFVSPSSPLVGRLHGGQVVVAVLVPGRPIMNLESGGFRADKVEEYLLSTCTVMNRQLVLKDGSGIRPKKGSNAAFDDCIIS